MILHAPIAISPRLMAAVKIGDGWISVEPTGGHDYYGKPVWHVYIDGQDGKCHETTAQGPRSHREAIETALVFLEAGAESYRYTMSGRASDNDDLWPEWVMEWAYQNDSEISMVRLELEES